MYLIDSFKRIVTCRFSADAGEAIGDDGKRAVLERILNVEENVHV
jgi:hypothetical protein